MNPKRLNPMPKSVINLSNFINLKAKAASVFAFLTGLVFVLSQNPHALNPDALIFFIAMLSFDIVNTSINSTADVYLSKEQKKIYPLYACLLLILLFLLVSLALSLYLACKYGLPLLIVGAFCFAVGIFYSLPPVSINKTHYGEAFAGFTMGFCIPLLVVLINLPQSDFLSVTLTGLSLCGSINLPNLLYLFLFTMPSVGGVFCMLLANDICDLPDDVAAKRYTLPYRLGQKYSFVLLAAVHVLIFTAIIAVAFISKNYFILLALAAACFAAKNLKKFISHPKKENYRVIINNFMIITLFYLITNLAGIYAK